MQNIIFPAKEEEGKKEKRQRNRIIGNSIRKIKLELFIWFAFKSTKVQFAGKYQLAAHFTSATGLSVQ